MIQKEKAAFQNELTINFLQKVSKLSYYKILSLIIYLKGIHGHEIIDHHKGRSNF